MAKFEFGFEESWFRLIIKLLPDNPFLFSHSDGQAQNTQTLLRIGKTKVGAAKVWADCAGIIEKHKKAHHLTLLGTIISKYDRDMDEDGIWWAIHYNLSKANSPAWFYSYYINEFDYFTFDRQTLEKELRDRKEMTDKIFDKLIFAPLKQVFDIDKTRLGRDFGLFQTNDDKTYKREITTVRRVTSPILAYALCDWAMENNRRTAHISKLLEPYAPGRIFGLDRALLDEMIMDIGERYQKQVAWISHTANLNSVSFSEVDPNALIIAYYRELDGDEPDAALKAAVSEVEDIKRDSAKHGI